MYYDGSNWQKGHIQINVVLSKFSDIVNHKGPTAIII